MEIASLRSILHREKIRKTHHKIHYPTAQMLMSCERGEYRSSRTKSVDAVESVVVVATPYRWPTISANASAVDRKKSFSE